jgi:hypothetical protein
MDGLKLAALKLHSAAPLDRDWILGRFDRATRRKLQGLLRDLQRSGINSGTAGDIDHAGLATADEPPGAADVATRLENAYPEAIARALAAEPAWVIAAVVNARAWSWRDAVLKRLRRRKALKRDLPGARPRPAVVSALLDALAQCTNDASRFEQAMRNSRSAGSLSAFWTRLREWTI